MNETDLPTEWMVLVKNLLKNDDEYRSKIKKLIEFFD